MTDKTKGFSFKTENKNILMEQLTPQQIDQSIKISSNKGRKPKKPEETIVKKILLTLTEKEYKKFKYEFATSGFPSESSFLKHLIKKNNII